MPDWMTDLQNEGTDFLDRAAMETPNRYNTPSNIPTYASHDPGQGDITRLPEGRTSSSVRQDGGQVRSLGSGHVNGCAVLAGFIGAALVFVFLCSMLSRFGGP